MTRLVIVGHGMAATRLIEALVMYKNGGISVTVIGEEPQLAYNRINFHRCWGRKALCANFASSGAVVSRSRRDGSER